MPSWDSGPPWGERPISLVMALCLMALCFCARGLEKTPENCRADKEESVSRFFQQPASPGTLFSGRYVGHKIKPRVCQGLLGTANASYGLLGRDLPALHL